MTLSKKENMLRVIRHEDPLWVPNGTEAIVQLPSPLAERPTKAGPDVFGVMWAYNSKAEGGTFPAPGGHVITDISRWREQLRLPDLDKVDWAALKALSDAVDRRENLVMGFVEMGLFERSYLLMGMEEALMCYLTDTEEMRALLHTLADYKIDLIERYVSACRLDLIWYGDDWGTQNNLFLPVDIWRATVGAETKRIYDCMKRLGVMINQHSCGRIESVFGDIVSMGAQLYNPCQPCNDLKRLKREYGERICFIGGIDSQHVLSRPGATPADVDEEVRRRIEDMAEGGGYIAAPSHNVPYDKALLDAMNTAIAKYGRYRHDEQ